MPAYFLRFFRDPAALAAFAFPVLVLVGNKLLTGGAVVLALAVLVWWRPADWRAARPFAVILGMIALWGAASAIWSIAPAESVERAARFAGLVVCGLVICQSVIGRTASEGNAVATGLLTGLAVAVCLALVGLAWAEFVGRSFLDALNYKPFATVAAILLFPVAGALGAQGRILPAVAGGVVLVVLFIWADSLAALVALAVGAAAFALVYFGRRRAAYLVSVGLAVAALAMPTVVSWSDSPSRISERRIVLRHSLAHRIAVWDFAGQRIMERPFLGWGLGAARRVPGAQANPLDGPRYRDMLLLSGIRPTTTLRSIPLHPHNAILQTWLELGSMGALLYLTFGGICFRQVIRHAPSGLTLAAGMATAASAVVIGQVSFSVWQSWWIAAQFLVAAILLALYRTES